MAASPPVLRQVIVPALLTLLITALRFCGELLDLAPPLFGREAGGGGALVGIGWLIPVFGAVFALRLMRHRQWPIAARKTATARSSTSSRPAASPAAVGSTGTVGRMPTPWCWLPSCFKTRMPVHDTT